MTDGDTDHGDDRLATGDIDSVVLELLEDLNRWTRESGLDPDHPESEVRSTGESNAAIDDLKRRIAKRGARIHWAADSCRYELDRGHG